VINQVEQLDMKLATKGSAGSNSPVGKIIVVDDEPELRSILVEALSDQGFEVQGCSGGAEALALLREKEFDLLLTDLMMPEMNGITLMEAAIEFDPYLIGIMMTGQGTIQTAVDAMKQGAFDYILKPFRLQTVMPVLTRAINTRRLRMENLQLRETVAIYGLCQTISFTLDPQTVLSRLADAALQQSDADEVSILLPTNDGTELYVAAVRGERRERLLGERVPLHDSISSWVARERLPLILNGQVQDERFVALWPRAEIRSAVSVPMQVANKLVGIINLNVINRLRPFTLGQMKALTILASTAAAALESASLYSQVQQAEKNYRSIFENAVEGIFQSTSDRRFLTVNPALANILGYGSPGEVVASFTDIGKQLYVDEACPSQVTRMLEEHGIVHAFEFEAYRLDGLKIWLSLNLRVVCNEQGKEICREGTLEDITERKRAEAERLVLFEITQGVITTRNLEELFKLIHESIGKILYAHNCFIGLYDETTSLMTFEYWADQFDPVPPPHPPGKGFSSHILRTSQPLLLTHELRNQMYASGEAEPIGRSSASWLGVPLRMSARAIGVLVVQHYDEKNAYSQRDLEFLASVGDQIALAIERKRAAEALTNSEAEMRALFAAMTDVIFVLDGSGRYLRIAPTDPTYLYHESSRLLDKTLHEVFPKTDADLFLKHVRRALAEGKTHRVEYCLQIAGTEVWFDGSVSPMSEDSVVWIARDISERKRAEEDKARLTGEIESQRQRLNNIVASVPGVVWEAWGEPNAANQRIDFVSDYVEQMLGYSTEEWTSTRNFWLSIIHPDDRQEAGESAAQAFASGKANRMEFRWLAKDGREVWVESNSVVVLDEQGQPLGMRGVNTDIGERKRAEEALRQSEERYRDLVENAHDLIYGHDLKGNFTSINKAGERMTGYSLEETLKLNLIQTLAPEYQEKALQMLSRKLAGEKVTAYDLAVRAKDGHHVMVEVNTWLVYKDGALVGVQGIARDITERRRAEEALRDSEARKRAILESSMDGVITMDHQGLIVDWNPAAEKAFAYSYEEAVGKDMAELIIPLRYREHHRQGLDRYLATGNARVLGNRLELSALRADGTEFPVELTITRIELEGNPMFTGYLRDITDRKEAERRLAAQYAVTRALAESNTISEGALKTLELLGESLGWEYGALWTIEAAHGVLRCAQLWNGPDAEPDEFEKMSRTMDFAPGIGIPGRVWKDSQPLWISELTEDENLPRSAAAAKAGFHSACGFAIPLRSEVVGVVEFFSRSSRKPDPALLAMMATVGSQIGQFIERKRVETALADSEDQLRQSQKLEAIGQLAGGVAHDFNNLLTVIGGYSSILLNKLEPDSSLRLSVEEIKKASDRAAGLTRQLLAFSRKQILQPKILDLNLVVSDLEKMVRRLIGEDIDLLAITDPRLGQVKADPGQLEQVLLNLIVNARDAMPSGGKLTIETANAILSADYALSHGAPGGPYVMLAVSDTGSGMDAELQNHVFEPFFTTKVPGKGTGLGLATVYGIVKQSDGHIWLYSEVGRGTCFKIYLPRVDKILADPAEPGRVAPAPKGTETLLLVEDEDQVREIVKAILEQQGYEVLTAANGEEALKIAELQGSKLQLLLTDLVMPQMSGRELAEHLSTTLPNLKVLYMSGYTDDAIVRHGLLDASLSFIQKPFDAATAARKVREVLDSGVL
jgi:PAS domain S-box-containing protein